MNKIKIDLVAFNAIDDPIVVINADCLVEGANDAYLGDYANSLTDVFRDREWLLLKKSLQEVEPSSLFVNAHTLDGSIKKINVKIKMMTVNGESFFVLHLKESDDKIDLLLKSIVSSPLSIVKDGGYCYVANQASLPLLESLDQREQSLLGQQLVSSVAPFDDSTGEPIGSAGYQVAPCPFLGVGGGYLPVMHDISNGKERENTLIIAMRYFESEGGFLQNIIDSLSVPLYVKDCDGRFLKVNGSFAKTFGKTALDMIGLTMDDLNMSDELRIQLNTFDDHFADNPVADFCEMFFRYPNGERMRARGYYSPLFDGRHQYMGLVCIIFDITTEWNLHQQLLASEERWYFAVKATNDAIWDYHYRDNQLFYYKKLLEILHLPLNCAKQTLDDFARRIHPDDLKNLSLTPFYFEESNQKESVTVEFRMMCGDLCYRWILLKALTIFDEHHKAIRAVGVLSDISERKAYEEKVLFQSTHDLLTNLPNRAYFYQEVNRVLEEDAESNKLFAVALLDLDGFKQINDTLGHQAGDQLLKIVAQRIVSASGKNQFTSRLGGDEFISIIGNIDSYQEAVSFMARMIQAISSPIRLDEGVVHIAGSIGVAFYPDHATDEHMLIRLADVAMYRSKKTGKNQITVWDSFLGY